MADERPRFTGLRTPARWRSAPVPDGFGDGPGPAVASGRVMLPLWLDWSGPPAERDLDDPVQRRWVYELVLTNGAEADVWAYIDPAVLVADWDELHLPAAVRETWAGWVAGRRGRR